MPVCRRCGAVTSLLHSQWVGDCFVCDSCGAGELATTAGMAPESQGDAPEPADPCSRARTRNLKLPGLQPGKQAVALRETEAGLQAAIVQALTLTGHIVLQTSEHRRGQTCPRCGQWQVLAGGRGTSKGVPDLEITHYTWPPGIWLAIEVKGPTTRISPEQKCLADAGRIFICRSVDEVLARVEDASRLFAGMRDSQ